MGQLLKQNVFPKADKIASIQHGDSEAQQVWQDIQNSNIIPSDVQVKQDNTDGEHYGVEDSSYNSDSDPDCWWTASGCKKPKHSNIPQDLYQCPEPNTWGLTFDDGPNCSHNAFYDFLLQNNLKATMFYIGSNVVNWPLQAQRGIVDGHDICLHTWSHRYMTTLSNEQVFAELYYTAKAIKIATGVTPTCWRPPFGDTDDRVRAIAAGLGLRTILWEEDTDDWNITPSGSQPTQKIDQNYQKIIHKASSESPIVLTHEIDQYTMGEFQKMYGQVKNAYKNIVPVSACQNVTHPYPEDITYPAFFQYINGGKATGLPDGNTIQVNANATYTPVALSLQKTGFAVTNQTVSTTSKDTNGTKNGSIGVTETAQSEQTTLSVPMPDTAGAKDANQSVDAKDLRKMLGLVKDVLKQTSMERKDQVSLLSALHSDTDAFHLLGDSSQATTASKELADALSMEFRMEKISLEDAQYADRLDAIRKRLGALATEVMQEASTNEAEDRTSEEPDVPSTSSRSTPWPRYYTQIFRVAACLLMLVIVGLRFLRFYADYMATYTYYDPFYPFLFPAPSLMLAYLPTDVYYNVPFTTTSKDAITGHIAPLDAIWAD
ncbi:hypothetical protein MBRA1_003044 [Malassezia brasiliensis]|uniref:chitin deacetylase n=1 Tax=Malassezia brasiliensis TaxID=1821822 RepID=A0AAF0DVW0_9BASI|nr:hypothetical protein MBRA1_003044 [Malassezia brasiliensis]